MSVKTKPFQRPQVVEIGQIHDGDAGRKDAFHFPAVRVSAAMQLQPGESVFFVSGTLVHPVSDPQGPKQDKCEGCWLSEETAKDVTHYTIEKGSRREWCEECAEGREYDPKPLASAARGDRHAIVDPFIPRPVEAGEVVWVFPVPELVSGVHHGFTVKPIDGEGRWGWISEEDEDYLNDSCRGCY